MTDSTQRELRMLANRMLTQTEARNGYQGSPVCLLLRKDAEKAMSLMTKAADFVDVLESSLRLQAEVAADANAQLNALLAENSKIWGWYTEIAQRHAARAAQQIETGLDTTTKPATLPLEIAGSLLPDDYVSPRLAAEAYRENEPKAVPDDVWVLQDARGMVGNAMLFWRKGGAGYTADLRGAETYTRDQAFAQHRVRDTDRPWPLTYLLKRAGRMVDVQDVKPSEWHAAAQQPARGE